MDEKEIIERCKNGDRLAMEQLYNYYVPKMKGLCVRYTRTVFEVEDILQDAFIKVFTSLKTFNFQGSFEGWIRRIVVNTAINAYRKNLNFNSSVNIEDVNENSRGAVEMADKLSADELHAVINKLPEGYKVVFNMYAIDGYSHKEIGDMLNITESTSRSQFTRAKKHLVHLLDQHKIVTNER